MFYSQHDPAYKKIRLGTCTTTLYESSCFLTSFCNFLSLQGIDIDPIVLNELCKKKGFFSNGCMFNASAVAKYFGFTYERINKKDVKMLPGLCVMETDMYKLKFPQHFVLFRPSSNERVDPLDSFTPIWETNNYPIVSYRVFTVKDIPIVALDKPIETPVVPIITQDESNTKSDVLVPVDPIQTQDSIETQPVEANTVVTSVDVTILKRFIQWLISFFKK